MYRRELSWLDGFKIHYGSLGFSWSMMWQTYSVMDSYEDVISISKLVVYIFLLWGTTHHMLDNHTERNDVRACLKALEGWQWILYAWLFIILITHALHLGDPDVAGQSERIARLINPIDVWYVQSKWCLEWIIIVIIMFPLMGLNLFVYTTYKFMIWISSMFLQQVNKPWCTTWVPLVLCRWNAYFTWMAGRAICILLCNLTHYRLDQYVPSMVVRVLGCVNQDRVHKCMRRLIY